MVFHFPYAKLHFSFVIAWRRHPLKAIAAVALDRRSAAADQLKDKHDGGNDQ